MLQARYLVLILAASISLPAYPLHPGGESRAAGDAGEKTLEEDPLPLGRADCFALRIASQHVPLGQVPLSQGVFLVAKPHIRDPRFKQTVILIVGHDQWGSIGLVVNRPSDVPLEKLLPDLPSPASSENFVYYGGPVEINLLHFLVKSPTPPQLGVPVLEDVYFLAAESVSDAFSRENKPGGILHAYVGYAGWSEGQLAHEIERGDWYVIKGDAASLFESGPVKLWRKLIRSLSGRWV